MFYSRAAPLKLCHPRARPTLAFSTRLTARAYSARLPSSTSQSTRALKCVKRATYFATGIGAFWIADQQFNASAISRNLRTLWTCMVIALDYKINFRPDKSEEIPALHQRVADRIYHLLTSNGGLYIKIGQAIGNNAALLPRPIQEKFGKLFDDAPQVPYSVVRSVILSEFGRPPDGPEGVFEVFEERATASASVAQVHRAKLKTPDGDGEWVAVKVQKPDVGKQVEWDLGAFRVVMWIYENYLFNLPVYFVVDFISDHLRMELDFEREARNAMQTAEFVASEPRLAGRVYIPKVYPEYSTKKVMVAEWIEGVRLSDRMGIMRLMGEDVSSDMPLPLNLSQPLRGGVAAVMTTMVELFSAQIFNWGWVHCDPHPGNIIIRPNPAKPSTAQLVLLDHGLYVRLSEEFRRQYATLWQGLLTLDFDVIKDVAKEWGIGTPDLFASATLLRPVKFKDNGAEEDLAEMNQYERSVWMKEKLKGFLTDTDKMPKELIFIGRNMRIVQGNNQTFGSPVNRIRITGAWASRSLTVAPNLTFTQRLHEYVRYIVYLFVTVGIDLAFWMSKIRQWIRIKMGLKGEGFEDELERTMRGFAKSNFGVEIADNAFEG